MSVNRLPLVLLPFLLASGSQSIAAARGETYTCHFGRYGEVVIDTREPGSTIMVGGKRYAAQSGSYFYQTEDGKIAFFGPGMRFWSYTDATVDPALKGIGDHHCVRRANRH